MILMIGITNLLIFRHLAKIVAYQQNYLELFYIRKKNE